MSYFFKFNYICLINKQHCNIQFWKYTEVNITRKTGGD